MKRRLPLPTLRGRWRDQLNADHELKDSAFRVGYTMAGFMTMDVTEHRYSRNGRIIVYPSQQRLHDQTGIGLRTISSSIAQLVDRGHLKRLTRGNQVGGSARYQIVLLEKQDA